MERVSVTVVHGPDVRYTSLVVPPVSSFCSLVIAGNGPPER